VKPARPAQPASKPSRPPGAVLIWRCTCASVARSSEKALTLTLGAGGRRQRGERGTRTAAPRNATRRVASRADAFTGRPEATARVPASGT
jgi:hypothetical protein